MIEAILTLKTGDMITRVQLSDEEDHENGFGFVTFDVKDKVTGTYSSYFITASADFKTLIFDAKDSPIDFIKNHDEWTPVPDEHLIKLFNDHKDEIEMLMDIVVKYDLDYGC